LASGLKERGWRLVAGGTDNHLLLVDVGARGLTGKQAEATLDQVGITVNKNTIPFDKLKPAVASGIRIGTAAVTTRGMGTVEMDMIAALIDRALNGGAEMLKEVRQDVATLCERFPLYEQL
jgi:glycine hydroxymethyltransferase